MFTTDHQLKDPQTTVFRTKHSESVSVLSALAPFAHLELHKPREGDRFRQERRCVHQSFLERLVVDA